MELSLPGANVRGNESSSYQVELQLVEDSWPWTGLACRQFRVHG